VACGHDRICTALLCYGLHDSSGTLLKTAPLAPKTRQILLRCAAALLLVTALAACGPLGELISPTAPAVSAEWSGLLTDLREFERSIGFRTTANFGDTANDQASFPFCGHAPRLLLPWSYEDPAIVWSDTDNEADCRKRAGDNDIFFRHLEARGESATPVTAAMLAGKLDRFVYLVIHEDCHDQFELPYGIEETVCDFLTHQAMIAFARAKYSAGSREQRSIVRYAESQAAMSLATIDVYRKIEALYARHQRGELSAEALLLERQAIYAASERPLGFAAGTLNNVSLASNMTYSRYYPQLEEAFAANGRDLARAVVFFRKIDAGQPTAASVQKQQRIEDVRSVEFLRAYENAVIGAMRAALRSAGAESARKL
jgi:hypothetical protein